MSGALREFRTDQIRATPDDDGHGWICLVDRDGGRSGTCDDQFHLQLREFGNKCWIPSRIVVRQTNLKDVIFAFEVAQLAHSVLERGKRRSDLRQWSKSKKTNSMYGYVGAY